MHSRHFVVAIVALGGATGACAGGDSGSTRAAESDRLTSATTTIEPASTTDATTSPPSSAATVTTVPPTWGPPSSAAATTLAPQPSSSVPGSDEARDIEQWVLGQVPGDDGWVLPAGTWHSGAFDPTLRFETAQDFVLVEQSREAIVLAAPGAVKSTSLAVLVPFAIASDDNVPTAPGGTEFEDYLRASEYVDIERFESFPSAAGDEIQYADISITAPPAHPPLPCRLGVECIWSFRSAEGGDIHAREGSPIRIVAREVDGLPVRVVATANDAEQFEALAAEALQVATSISTAPDVAATESPAGLLSMVSSRLDHFPPGQHAATLSDVAVVFDIDEQMDDFALNYVARDSIGFRVGDAGFFDLLRPWGYADPAAVQTNSRQPLDDQLLDEPPETADEYEAWIEAFNTITGRSERTIGGLPAVWWDQTPDPTGPSYECGPPLQAEAGGQCRNLFVTDEGGWWYGLVDEGPDGELATGRDYLIDGTGIIANMFVLEPTPIDEIDAMMAPLLDSITFLIDEPVVDRS